MDDHVHAGCDRQDIMRAGITQDIGVVAVIDTAGLILAISDDHYDRGWVTKEVGLGDVENVYVQDIFHKDIVAVIKEGIVTVIEKGNFITHACDIFFTFRTHVTMFAQSDGRLVLEIEDFKRSEEFIIKSVVETANAIGKMTAKTCQVETAKDLCGAVFETSSYDRAMVYKFLDDLSGEVVYEMKHPGEEISSSFMGLRFPPGDIPLPARKAYLENPVRFIADAEKPSRRLLQKNDDISLSRSYLRGCVPPHISYLRSMGVRSSISISITNMDGELWGLVVMHSYTKPIIPTIEDRVSYTILASVASSHVQYIEKGERLAIETKMKNLVSRIDVKESLGVFLAQTKTRWLETFRIDSVSLFTTEGSSTIVGENGVTLAELPMDDEPLVCGSLEHPIRSFACLNVLGYRIVFTRSCSWKPIYWAGNPGELLDAAGDTVMPRKSFQKYLEHRSQTPPPFTKQDRVFFSKTADFLKSVIHQIKIESVERYITQTRKEKHLVELKSDENYAFFANMSHELRTPLHAISGVFDIIHNLDDKEEEKQRGLVRRYTKIGLDTCKDMMKTLNDILTIVKKTHEQKQLEVSLTMVKDIFNSTVSGLKMFAAKNGVIFDITFQCDADKLVRVDLQKTIQVFNNICGNAIKFSDRHGKVDVQINVLDSEVSVLEMWSDLSLEYACRHSATENDASQKKSLEKTCLCKWLVFITRDKGCGVCQADMSKMFEMFSQVGDVITKKFASTGLGLHISLNNVKAMGGFLSIASTPEKGSLLFCAFPVEDVLEDSIADESESDTTLDQEDDPTFGFGSKEVVFVVVDDSKVNLMIAKKQIERAFINASVYTGANGKLGVEEIERLQNLGVEIDGIFMDYHMPIMSGLEATRQIRTTANCKVPVAMLTADITENSRQSMLASGADFILLKPSRPREILAICVKMIQLNTS